MVKRVIFLILIKGLLPKLIPTVCHNSSVLYYFGYSGKSVECALIPSTTHLLPLSSCLTTHAPYLQFPLLQPHQSPPYSCNSVVTLLTQPLCCSSDCLEDVNLPTPPISIHRAHSFPFLRFPLIHNFIRQVLSDYPISIAPSPSLLELFPSHLPCLCISPSTQTTPDTCECSEPSNPSSVTSTEPSSTYQCHAIFSVNLNRKSSPLLTLLHIFIFLGYCVFIYPTHSICYLQSFTVVSYV